MTRGRCSLAFALALLVAAACGGPPDAVPTPTPSPSPSELPASFVQEARLTASPAQAGAAFGFALAAAGDTLVAGAYLEDTAAGRDAGAAYVFVRSGGSWVQQQRLVASDGAAGDEFGRAVAVSGDTVVVGGLLNDHAGGRDAGAAYVFVRTGTTWREQQKLTAPDAAEDDQFGFLVTVSGDRLVAGSHLDDNANGAEAGSAYVFARSGTAWTMEQKLLAPDGAADDRFGFPVALDGSTLAVGSYRNDTAGGVDAGAVYVFIRSGTGWSMQQKIVAPDGAADDQFGRWVSVSGDTLAVGSILDDNANGADAGSAYVFVRSGSAWSLQQKLSDPAGGEGDQFGRSVSVSGPLLAVGAYLDDSAMGPDTGSAFVCPRSGTSWTPRFRLAAAEGAAGDLFGRAVAFAGSSVVVGSEGADLPAGDDAGAVYVFRPAGP
jgi:FG-GAP repeat protein